MKKLLFFAFAALAAGCSKSNDPQPVYYDALRFTANSLVQMNLRDRVRSVVESGPGGATTYEFNPAGMIVFISTNNQAFTYDAQGRISVYSSDDFTAYFSYGDHDKYVYTNLLNIENSPCFLKGLTSVRIVWGMEEITCLYQISGSTGTMTQSQIPGSAAAIVPVSQMVFDGQLPVSTIFTNFNYHKFLFNKTTGNILRIIDTGLGFPAISPISVTLSFKDDDHNRLSERVQGSLTTTYSYNTGGELEKQSVESSSGGTPYLCNFSYDYDTRGNWIKRNNNSTAGKEVVNRTITYY